MPNIIDTHKVTFTKFCLVGGISTILNYSVFYILFRSFSTNYLISSSAGYLAGTFLGFILNKRYTFNSKYTEYKRELLKYFFIYTISLFLGLLILRSFVLMGINVLIANFLIIGFTTITNYIGTRYLVFNPKKFKKLDYIFFRYRYLLTYIFIGLNSILIEVVFIGIVGYIFGDSFLINFSGFILGMIFSFLLNLKLNFNVPKNQNLRVFGLFFFVSLLAYFLNLLFLKMLFTNFSFTNYAVARFISAGCIFLISYSLHRKITFRDTKQIGLAVYLKKGENISKIYNSVGDYPDWIHIDLVDNTFNKESEEVYLKNLQEIKAFWKDKKKMIHLMSKYPSKWVDEVSSFVDYIVIDSEISEPIEDVIKKIKDLNKKVGISLSPDTNIKKIPFFIFKKADLIQILGIREAGKSGQQLDYDSLKILNYINQVRKHHNFRFDICFDGGIRLLNIDKINAKFIVSASAVLESEDPKMSIFNLKSNARYLDIENKLKKFTEEGISEIAKNNSQILSCTLVGSFLKKQGLEGISDIDIVVIVKKLNQQIYQDILNEFNKLGNKISSNFGYDFYINSSLGPLKFNKRNQVVFHLMMYDIDSHKDHFIQSPFTCLDWQKSPNFFKAPMNEIWCLNKLSLKSFFNSRRSVKEYTEDLKYGKISYREYVWDKGKVRVETKYKPMENRDKIEFAYHIMKFCMLNFLKIYLHKNLILSEEELITKYFKIFKIRKFKHKRFFKKILKSKSHESFFNWSKSDENAVNLFLSDFEKQFKKEFYTGSKKIIFLRHKKTDMNLEGQFIGQRSNPHILPFKGPEKELFRKITSQDKFKVYSSESLRAMETAKTISGNIIIDPLLNEIDYGLVDGKNINFLRKKYPEIIDAWKNNEDPSFPEGENYADLLERIKIFLFKIRKSESNLIIVTHNVFLRALIGNFFEIPMAKWHMIKIDHLKQLSFILKRGHIYIDIMPEEIEYLFGEIR